MVGLGQVSLDLVQVGAHDGVGGVLLSLDVAGLQGEVHLVPSHRGGGGAHGLPHSHVVGVLHGADQHAVIVGQGLHVAVGSGLTEGGVLQGAQQLEAGLVEGGAQALSELGLGVVDDFVDGGTVIGGEHHGQVVHGNVGDEGRHRGGLAHKDVDVAALQLAQQVGVSAQLAVGEVVHGQLAAGDGVQLLGHHLAEQLAGGVGGGGVSADQLDGVQAGVVSAGAGVRGRGAGGAGIGSAGAGGAGVAAAAGHQGHAHGQSKNESRNLLHLQVLLFFMLLRLFCLPCAPGRGRRGETTK